MKALIIDDEFSARQALKQLIFTNCPTIELLGEADSGAMGIEAIKHHKPELVFLDVELQDMSSFDMLDALGFPNISFDIIFSTAHDHYAVTAFRYSAVDFLPKPVQEKTLLTAVMQAQERLRLKQKLAYQVLQEHVKQQIQLRMVISTATEILIMPIENVLRMHAVKGKPATEFMLTNNKRYTVSKNLGEYELLDPFIRVHNSTIINPNHMVCIHKKGAIWQVEMTDGERVDITASKKTKVVEWLERIK
jgi:two-component system, LytTR family, response regulator